MRTAIPKKNKWGMTFERAVERAKDKARYTHSEMAIVEVGEGFEAWHFYYNVTSHPNCVAVVSPSGKVFEVKEKI